MGRDLVTAAATAAVAGAYLYLGRGLEAGIVRGVPGPGAFPWLLALGLLLCATWLAARAAVRGRRHGPPAERAIAADLAAGGGSRGAAGRGRVVVLYVLFGLYVLAIPAAGFPLATLLFSVAAMVGAFGLGLVRSAGYAVAVTLLAEGLFRVGLGVPLPRGWLFG